MCNKWMLSGLKWVDLNQCDNTTDDSKTDTITTSPTTEMKNDESKMTSPHRTTTRVWKLGDQPIGGGTFGTVWKGAYVNKPERVVAVKKSNGYHYEFSHYMYQREYTALARIKDTHVVRLIAAELSRDKPSFVIYEYCKHQNLEQFIIAGNGLKDPICKYYFAQIIEGLQAIHNMGVVHRDMKPENLLIDDKFNIKISDFGLSLVIIDEKDVEWHEEKVGTPQYIAPEIFDAAGAGLLRQTTISKLSDLQACDIYSVGIIFYQMKVGPYFPFDSAQRSNAVYSLLWTMRPDYERFWKLLAPVKTKFEPIEQDLFNRMIEYDPTQRITIKKIKKHVWYKNEKDNDFYKVKRSFQTIMGDLYSNVQHLNDKKVSKGNGPGNLEQTVSFYEYVIPAICLRTVQSLQYIQAFFIVFCCFNFSCLFAALDHHGRIQAVL